LKACARKQSKRRRAICDARARREARARRKAPAAPAPTSTPTAFFPVKPPASSAPIQEMPDEPPIPVDQPPIPVDGPICPGASSVPCPCPPGVAEAFDTEPNVPAGDGLIAIEVYPALASPEACPGIELTVDDASATRIATLNNVPESVTVMLALAPGRYEIATIVPSAPFMDASAIATVVAGQRTNVTLQNVQ
jgi:hypothetical protein